MGLDMYLTKRTYVKNWEHMKPEERHSIVVKKNGKDTKIKPERIHSIIEEIACWRKANAIHRWFVQNVQDGEDDCRDYYVSGEKLQELLKLCETVILSSKLVKGKINNGYTIDKKGLKIPILADGEYIADSKIAHELLPTTDGFFFGSTDYDSGYLDDIKYTRDILIEVLAEDQENYYYHSSW